MSARVAALAFVALGVCAVEARAADPRGVYARVQRTLETPDDDPSEIWIWGAFALSGPESEGDAYARRGAGYLRFVCRTDRPSCQEEWRQIARVAGADTCVGFGTRLVQPTIHLDPEGRGAASDYEIGFGVLTTDTGPGNVCASLRALVPADAAAPDGGGTSSSRDGATPGAAAGDGGTPGAAAGDGGTPDGAASDGGRTGGASVDGAAGAIVDVRPQDVGAAPDSPSPPGSPDASSPSGVARDGALGASDAGGGAGPAGDDGGCSCALGAARPSPSRLPLLPVLPLLPLLAGWMRRRRGRLDRR